MNTGVEWFFLIVFVILKILSVSATRYLIHNIHIQRGYSHMQRKPMRSSYRSYNSIAKVITGNPYIHHRSIYSKTDIYPRQPFWNFKNN